MPYITLEIDLCEDDARLLNTLCINGKDGQDVIVELIRHAAQQSGQRTCLKCGSQSFNDYQGYLKCNVCGSIPTR